MTAAAAPSPRPRVAIVEDHELLAESLVFAFSRRGIEASVVDVEPVEDLADRIAAGAPDLALVDLQLGNTATSLPVIPALRARGVEVVVMTGSTSETAWAECVEAGASSVVSKTAPLDELLDSVECVLHGERAMPAPRREELLDLLRSHRARERERLEPFSRLSRREEEVLAHLLEGHSAEFIASSTYVSVATVRSHIRGILSKLGVNSQLAAVAVARRNGWRPPAQVTTG
ncbi:MAG: hypothetical protein KatS3mg009_1129 [Acidimicrobiia bacterium]|nr:MAG: hypothetical protein KatS3mg009_1129 [Acidimicrobiia bacterium]